MNIDEISSEAWTAADVLWIWQGLRIPRNDHEGMQRVADAHNAAIKAAIEKASLTELFCPNCDQRLKLRAAQASEDSLESRYYELIYAVSRKFLNETRHQTALRYILDAEMEHQRTAHVDEQEKKDYKKFA